MSHTHKTVQPKEPPAQLRELKRTPEFKRGMDIISTKLQGAKNWVELISKQNMEAVDEFEGHVNELIQKAITHGILSPEAIVSELSSKGEQRQNLLMVDLLIWHTFEKAPGMLPYGMLTDPGTDNFNGEYIKAFTNDHKLFWELRKLDIGQGFDLESYKRVLLPHEEQRLLRVLRANCLDNSSLVDDKAVPIAAAIGGGLSFEKPDPEKWIEMRKNVAESVLAFWTNMADFLGNHPLVADMKDFAVRIIYPGIWEYVEYEMNRLEVRKRRTHEIIEEINAEVKRGLKSRGIDAEFIIRHKSWGSAGLKVKERTEKSIAKDLADLPGKIEASITDPRVSEIEQGNGIWIKLDGKPLRIEFVSNGIWIHYPSERDGLYENGFIPTHSAGLIPQSRFVFRHLEGWMNDIEAVKIVVTACKDVTRESVLVRRVYEVTSEILKPAIDRTLRKRGVTSIEIKTEDLYAKKDHTYNSLHTDVKPESDQLVPFEFIVRTETDDDECEHGKAAHIFHKGVRTIAEFIREIGNKIRNGVTEKPVSAEPKEKIFKVSVKVGGRNPITVNAREGERFVDAIAKACNLKDIGKVASETGTPVMLSRNIEMDCGLVVTTVTDQKDAMFARANLARSLLEHCVTGEAKKQLQGIMKQGSGNHRKR